MTTDQKKIREKDMNIASENIVRPNTIQKMSIIKSSNLNKDQDENCTPVSTKFFYENPDQLKLNLFTDSAMGFSSYDKTARQSDDSMIFNESGRKTTSRMGDRVRNKRSISEIENILFRK